MDSPQNYFVSFYDQQVEILCDDPAVIAPFLLSFRDFLVDQPTELLATLKVARSNGSYSLQGGRTIDARDVDQHRILQSLKFEVIHQFVEVHPELLWLHAGAAACQGDAVLLCGAWGSGKSTLVGHLCKKGWTYLSDDIVPIELASGKLLSFPLTPMMRLHNGVDAGTVYSPEEISKLNKQVVELEQSAFVDGAQQIAAIIFPRFDPQAERSELDAISPATAALELLRNCLDLKYHKEDAVQYLSNLVERLPVFKLCYTDGEEAAENLISASQAGF